MSNIYLRFKGDMFVLQLSVMCYQYQPVCFDDTLQNANKNTEHWKFGD